MARHNNVFQEDFADSDDMEAILAYTQQDIQAGASSSRAFGASGSGKNWVYDMDEEDDDSIEDDDFEVVATTTINKRSTASANPNRDGTQTRTRTADVPQTQNGSGEVNGTSKPPSLKFTPAIRPMRTPASSKGKDRETNTGHGSSTGSTGSGSSSRTWQSDPPSVYLHVQGSSKPPLPTIPQPSKPPPSKAPPNQPSTPHASSERPATPQPPVQYSHYDRPDAKLLAQIEEIDAEVVGCQADITDIQKRIQELEKRKEGLVGQLKQIQGTHARGGGVGGSGNGMPGGQGTLGGRKAVGIDYGKEVFAWTDGLKKEMREVFGIQEFRLCQAGVCNANMDGRDIVCIMPTGGGKSLTYQLPALLTAGCTLVISPLISLMTDQILHLRDNNVEAEMITSANSKAEKTLIENKLKALAEGTAEKGKELKLCYVTPEKDEQSTPIPRVIYSELTKRGNWPPFQPIARIVIDEAHCVSQMGHDYRPDYKELHILRTLFPRVPIMALSATCGRAVLDDLLTILKMEAVVDGSDAPARGTAYFTSSLYRANLRYRVVPKPNTTKEQHEAMKNYILENHPGQTGIIYCYSKKDAQLVSDQLQELSEGKIKTGVYHADRTDQEKHALHVAWREGKVKVVCATIAFGMGIDKSDVRFVLHHSKSLEGFYQESGRAGRDGKDSDCVLYYRPQDAWTMAGYAATENEGARKLYAMLGFAEDLKTCRKVQFATYFSHASELSVSSWSTDEADALDRCGHCDNCTRDESTVNRAVDVTLATWQLIKIINAVRAQGGKLTLVKLAKLARGASKGAYEVPQKKRGKKAVTDKANLDLDSVCGGAVEMKEKDIEHLIIRLLTQSYLACEYQQTEYTTYAYVIPGTSASRLNRHTRESIEAGGANVKISMDFVKPPEKTRKAKAATSKGKGKKKADGMEDGQLMLTQDVVNGSGKKRKAPARTSAKGKGKARAAADDDDDGDGDGVSEDEYDIEMVEGGKSAKRSSGRRPTLLESDDDMYTDGDDSGAPPPRRARRPQRPGDGSSSGEEFDWSYNMYDEPDDDSDDRPPKKRRKSGGNPESTTGNLKPSYTVVQEGGNEVLEIDSDSD